MKLGGSPAKASNYIKIILDRLKKNTTESISIALVLVLESANMQRFKTREEWMNHIANEMRPMFDRVNARMPDRVRLSMSLCRGKKAVGQCFDAECSTDHTYEILVRLDQADPLEVAAIIAHELIHAAIGVEQKHGPEFKRVALDLGLEGRMSQTRPGDRFKGNIEAILIEAGDFPHARLDWEGKRTGPKKQTSRMRKVECKGCGYVARVASKWLELGAPHCPTHGPMGIVATPEDEEAKTE